MAANLYVKVYNEFTLNNHMRRVCQLVCFLFLIVFFFALVSLLFFQFRSSLTNRLCLIVFLNDLFRIRHSMRTVLNRGFSLKQYWVNINTKPEYLFIFTYGNETACTISRSNGQRRYAEIRFVWIGWHEISQYNNEC